MKPRESPTLIPIMAGLVKSLVGDWETAVATTVGKAVEDRVDIKVELATSIGELEGS